MLWEGRGGLHGLCLSWESSPWKHPGLPVATQGEEHPSAAWRSAWNKNPIKTCFFQLPSFYLLRVLEAKINWPASAEESVRGLQRRSWNHRGITQEYAYSKVLLRAQATPCNSHAFYRHLQLQQNLLSPLIQPCRVQGSPVTAKYIDSAPSLFPAYPKESRLSFPSPFIFF